MQRKYNKNNLIFSRTEEKFVCLFMTKDYSEVDASIIVEKKNINMFSDPGCF